MSVGAAQELPPGPGEIPQLRRGADGSIEAVPPAPPPQPTAASSAAATPASHPVPRPLPTRDAPLPKPPMRSSGSLDPMAVCAAGAITCVEAVDTGARRQRQVPVTFGEPFAPGDFPGGSTLVARDGSGAVLPIQMDEVSSHPDGSVRFAVLTTMLPDLPANGRVVINLFRSAPQSEAPGIDAARLLASGYDLSVEAETYSPQVSVIVFGNRRAYDSGIPFLEGETVTIALGELPEDRHSITITPELAGGKFETLTKLATAFMNLINASKGHYSAYKVGEAGGYERLWVTPREMPGSAFAVHFLYSGKAKLQATNLEEFEPPRRFVAKVRPLLENTNPATWLNGPVATEFTLRAPLVDATSGEPHPQLTARFDVRAYAGSPDVRTNVAIENDWSYEPSPGNKTYDVTIRLGGRMVFQRKALNHFQHSRWHRVVWNGDPPAVHVRYPVAYWFRSRMIPTYDTSIQIPDSVLADEMARLDKADTGPMGNAFILQYMPTTGGRADIGPLPTWTAMFLLSQDPRAEAVMLANGDAADSIPIHYRDRPTDQPVSLDDHPGLAMMFGNPAPRDRFPAMSNGDTPWTPDAAHLPSLAYVPYLVTGDRYYLDEIMFWADWVMGIVDPGPRGGNQGLIWNNQIRGQAWSLRSIGEAALAVPDNHPMKRYFVTKLRANLEWYVQRYARNPDTNAASPMGWIERVDAPGSSPPWQTDFLSIEMGWLASAGEPAALEFFKWNSRYTVGLWTHEAEGYCRTDAPAYYLRVRTKDGRAIEDWAQLFHENWPNVKSCPAQFAEGSYPESSLGYVANARAALAVAAGLGISGAAEAYRRLVGETVTATGAMAKDPTWAVAPGPPPEHAGR